MKLYKDRTNFQNVQQHNDSTDFMTKDHFDVFEDEDEIRKEADDDANRQNLERIKLPSGNWISRNLETGENLDLFGLNEEAEVEHPLQGGDIETLQTQEEMEVFSLGEELKNVQSKIVSGQKRWGVSLYPVFTATKSVILDVLKFQIRGIKTKILFVMIVRIN